MYNINFRENHPCFNEKSKGKFARLHLPVAAKCNIQCNYCNRKHACLNENRPGVSVRILSPYQALYYLDKIREKMSNLSVVGIAGPGDAFASPEESMKTLRLIREKGYEYLLCLATNGLNILPYIEELSDLNVSHVTITVNSIDCEIGSKIYAWVRDNKNIYRGIKGAQLLWDRQKCAIKKLAEKNILVKVNCIVIPGINDQHVEKVAKEVSLLGASIFNPMPMFPVENTPFELLGSLDKDLMHNLKNKCSQYLNIMTHCNRCRSDAAGLIGQGLRKDCEQILIKASNMPINPYQKRPFIAVATNDDEYVNMHLGQARYMKIFEKTKTELKFIETRMMPEKGLGDVRWDILSETLKDCNIVFISGIGDKPFEILRKKGLKIINTEAKIKDVLNKVFSGKEMQEEDQAYPRGCKGPEFYGFSSAGCLSSSCSKCSSIKFEK